MQNLALGRVALGAVAFAAPGLTGRLLGLGAGDGGRDYITRAFAARELALGGGYLLARGRARDLWARLGLAVDALDTVSGAKSRGAVPLWATAAAVAVSGGATALGAAKVGRDLVK
ncbi:hypothetical protein K1Y72_25440 [Actinomadura sp. PM05-2]|uniref:DUF4267 domain-containing protein n=2 Tax=Actinomadura parmotrematis TaxID=2864039 RepID=A0ABS7FZ81_9ACTN|nr:hypothetical protein [Actinomadura parmotrematis]